MGTNRAVKRAIGRPKGAVALVKDSDRLALTFVYAYMHHERLRAMAVIDGLGSIEPIHSAHRAARVWSALHDFPTSPAPEPLIGEHAPGIVAIDRDPDRRGAPSKTKAKKKIEQDKHQLERIRERYFRFIGHHGSDPHPDIDDLDADAMKFAAIVASILYTPNSEEAEKIRDLRKQLSEQLIERGFRPDHLSKLFHRIEIQYRDFRLWEEKKLLIDWRTLKVKRLP